MCVCVVAQLRATRPVTKKKTNILVINNSMKIITVSLIGSLNPIGYGIIKILTTYSVEIS